MKTYTYDTTIQCYHCGQDCDDKLEFNNHHFCCEGCKTVYEIINDNNLCKYYDISKTPGVTAKGKFISDKFAYLDDTNIQSKLISFTDGKQTRITFYLPQIHCASCVWLLENLHKINSGIVRSQVNFLKKEVTVQFLNEQISLRKVVETLAFIGYEPHISLNDAEKIQPKKYNKKQLFKIGVAGFCFGNIMMLSFPEYFSFGNIQEESLKTLFSYLILVLSLPVFFFCASGFFVSAWASLKQKQLNIDAPIALAILVTFSRSVFEILSGTSIGYMDSMSGIVFFMLIGRLFQDKTYNTLSFERDYKSYFPIAVTTIQTNGEELSTPVSNIKVGDRIVIKNNEIIPADAILFKGNAAIDYSFVTGESLPVEKTLGEVIYAGGKQTQGAIELEVIKNVSQSYLTQLWNDSNFDKKVSEENNFVNRIGKYITYAILLLAVSGFLYWLPTSLNRALNSFTAVLIVACQCAFLLAATFTYGNILRILGKNKFYLKNANVIENISNIDTIVFDKTGTITQNSESSISYQGKELSSLEQQLIRTLTSQSSHPLSKKIVEYLPLSKMLEVSNYKEITGSGIQATVGGYEVKIGSENFIFNKNVIDKENKTSTVFISIENVIYGKFLIQNKYRNHLDKLVDSLKGNYLLRILSGDNNSEKVALQRIFPADTILNFNQSPTDKLNFIKQTQLQNHNVAMIGDGLNDAGALKQSNVGIAVADDVNNFSPACDAILDASRFKDLKTFFDFAKAGKKIILASFTVSLIYNSIGLSIAVHGTLSPVIAAILMPLSSITIVIFTTGLTNLVARKKGLNAF